MYGKYFCFSVKKKDDLYNYLDTKYKRACITQDKKIEDLESKDLDSSGKIKENKISKDLQVDGNKKEQEADNIRLQIKKLGYQIIDTNYGYKIKLL